MVNNVYYVRKCDNLTERKGLFIMKCYLLGAKHKTGEVSGNRFDNVACNFEEEVSQNVGWGYMPVLITSRNTFNGQTTTKTNVITIKTKDIPNIVQSGINLLDPNYKGRLFELSFDLYGNVESIKLCQK